MRSWPIHLFFGTLVLLELLFLYAHLSERAAMRAASGIETEGRNNKDWSGAKHESPTGKAGDAQGPAQ